MSKWKRATRNNWQPSDQFKDNYDRIFGKKPRRNVQPTRMATEDDRRELENASKDSEQIDPAVHSDR